MSLAKISQIPSQREENHISKSSSDANNAWQQRRNSCLDSLRLLLGSQLGSLFYTSLKMASSPIWLGEERMKECPLQCGKSSGMVRTMHKPVSIF